MTCAGVLSPPAPEVTDELARVGLAAWGDPDGAVSVATHGLREPVDVGGSLRAWAEAIATPTGFPLLGTDLSAPTYAALLWNGVRLDAGLATTAAVGAGVDGAALLAALAASDATLETDRVGRALAAAERVRRSASTLLGGDTAPVALPTLSTLAAATAAALVGPRAGDGLARILDLAASLMVLAPGTEAGAGSLSWTGHAAASGWLAAVLPDDATTPMPGSVAHTLSAASGRAVPPRGDRSAVDAVLEVVR